MREFENKIINVDCLTILSQIPDNSIDLIITDPPYMISQPDKKISRKTLNAKSWKRNMDIKLDFGSWDNFSSEQEFFDFTESWFKECVRVLKPKSWFYIFFDKQKTGYFDLVLGPKYGMKSRTIFAWLKSNPTPSFRLVNYLSASEFIWVGSKGECKLKNFLKQTEMFNYMITPNKSAYGQTCHPTEKPLSLIAKFIKTSSNEGDIILDPFLGSGTTAIMSKILNRKYLGIEKDEKYYKMSCDRIGDKYIENELEKLSKKDPKQNSLF